MSETVKPGGTYRTRDEQREVLSPAEERFEKARQTIGRFLGPVAFLVVYFLPTGLPSEQQTLAVILAFTIVYWLSRMVSACPETLEKGRADAYHAPLLPMDDCPQHEGPKQTLSCSAARRAAGRCPRCP